MSETRILYYDLETKDIIKIIREVDTNLNDPYYEIAYDDVKDFIDGTKVQSQYYVKLNPKDPTDFSLLKKEIHLDIRELDKTLINIPKGEEDNLSYDIRVIHSKKEKTISFEFNPTLKAYMASKYQLTGKTQKFTNPEMLVINGTSVLNFFITQTGDPHDLFASYYVPVAQLLTQDKLTAPYQGELTSCNVYTRRIYDDYLMVEI
tara:strand:+ start:2826 stop:3440 length:615 start_codon:yes stop_codon:yes gene_type:complete